MNAGLAVAVVIIALVGISATIALVIEPIIRRILVDLPWRRLAASDRP